MKKSITTMTVFVMTLCFAIIANAAPITFGGMNDKIPADSRVKIGTMKNGMKYYVRHNEKPENRAELRLVVRAGAFQEDDDQDGLAHNTEHMLFNGTKNFPKDALVKYLESTGMRFGADINASTSQERTLYMLQLPTDNQEIMDKGFQVLEDWAHLASFDKDEIDKERGVIIEEWRTRMGANRRVINEHNKNLWDGTRYQLRNTIGADTNLIRNYDHDVIRRFYKDWYRPDLQAVIAVGDFDVDEMEKKIIAQFGKIPVHPNPREYKIYPLPKHKGIKVSIVQDKEYSRGMAHLMWVRDAVEPGTVGAMYKGFVRSLYDAMLGARLSELTQQAKPPYFGAMGGEGRMTFGTRVYALRYEANPTAMMTGYEAILKEAFRVKQHGFTATELDRTKAAFIKRFKSYYSEREKSESKGYASEFFRNFLYKETMPGIEYEYEFVKHFMPKITLEEINALAQEYMIRDNLAVMITAPEKEGLILPSEEDFIAVYDKISNIKLDAYDDKVSDKPLFSKNLTPGTITDEKEFKDLGVTEIRLSNGVKVILKPTNFKNNEIHMRAFSPGGSSLVKDKDYVSAMFSSNIVNMSGIADFSNKELKKMLSGKQVSVNPVIRELTEGFSGFSVPDDLETMMQLTHLYFTDMREDDDAVSALREQLTAQLANAGLNPGSVFRDSVSWTMDNHHFRSRPLTVAMLYEFDQDKAYEIFRDRFADASDFTFFFVGSFDIDKMKTMVQKYLGSLPNKVRVEQWNGVKKGYPTGNIRKDIKAGQLEKSTVRVAFSGDYKWNRENNFIMSALTRALNMRLREVVREEKSGTYGAYSYPRLKHFPYENYSVYINFDCETKRVEELLQAAKDQIAYLKKAPLGDEYVQKIKEISKRQVETDMQNNRYWTGALYNAYFNHTDPTLLLKRNDLIDKLTGKDIQEAAKKYLSYDNFARFVLYQKDQK